MLLNEKHNAMLYAKTKVLTSRDETLEDKYGERYKQYRQIWNANVREEGDIPEFPIHYECQLTDSCNLKCAICHDRKRTGVKIDIEVLKKVINEGKKYGLCACSFGLDSESLIDKQILLDTIDCAKNANVMDIMLGTNGILLTEDLSEKLIMGGVTMLRVSIDAATAETYKKMRHSDKFEIVEENIKKFVEIKQQLGLVLPQVRISFCKTYLNSNEENQFIEKWSNIVDQIDIQNYISIVGELQDFSSGKRIENYFCKDSFRRVGILANGDVQCCCSSFGSPDIIIGNIYEQSMYDIWNGQKMKAIQKAFLYDCTNIPDYCKKCIHSRWSF